ncbi:hypothetical protein CR513_19374, partial [Mucuna pruriens]
MNGYKFRTILWNEGMNSLNHGVYARGTNGQLESDFYGNVSDIIKLEYAGTKVHNKYKIVEVRESRRYNKGWLVVIKTKVRSTIIHNILPDTEQEAPYQDDDFVELQVVLHIDSYVINGSLVDIHGGGKEIDRQLLHQTDFDEPNDDAYISSESDVEMIMRGK